MNGEVMIVDEFTGRIWPAAATTRACTRRSRPRRGVEIKDENQTLATITLQNFFRLYEKLAGMTGTAMTEAAEFQQIYKLGVVPIPTNRAADPHGPAGPDLPHRGGEVRGGRRGHRRAQRDRASRSWSAPPRSRSPSTSRSMLQQARRPARGPQRQVPRARGRDRRPGRPQGRGHRRHQHGRPRHRHHARRQPRDLADGELRQRGLDPDGAPRRSGRAALPDALGEGRAQGEGRARRGRRTSAACTCSGTERHESRRIDNQLRGRAGRQGDPGESRFYLSLDDDLMRMFKAGMVERVLAMAQRPEGRADRAQDGHPRHRQRPDPGRAAELRDPQERPEVRRGPQPPARGDLRRAPPGAGGRGPAGAGPAR